MPRVAAALVFGALLFTSNLAGAAELTGFGPIKFGMSKEEALAALEAEGIEGEWDGEALIYSHPIRQPMSVVSVATGRNLKVRQHFENGRAIGVGIFIDDSNLSRSYCLMAAMHIANTIRGIYKKEPIFANSITDNSVAGTIMFLEVDVYMFDFPQNSAIHVISTWNVIKDSCDVETYYIAPTTNPVPF